MKRAKTTVIALCLLVVVGLIALLVTRRDSGPGQELEDLRHDPMASWQPSSAAGAEQETIERSASKGLTQPVQASLVRSIPLKRVEGVLDEAIDAATAAGWQLRDRQPASVRGVRLAASGLATNAISVIVLQGTDTAGPSVTIGLDEL